MTTPTCYIGIDVGLTTTKTAAFDIEGGEIAVVSDRTPRTAITARRHDVDMTRLADTVLALLAELAGKLAADGHTPAGIGVAGHGNGIYPVTAQLQPAGPAIASSDSRAQSIIDQLPQDAAGRLAEQTGSIPWAAQPAVLLRWLADHEPQTYQRTRWALSCKDWVTSQLTGQVSADYSDASAFGMVDLNTRQYTSTALDLVGLPSSDLDKFPPLHRSDEVIGGLTSAVADRTGLPDGLPVIAGCMDCVAATLGAGGREPGDVTIIVGTWAINAVVAPARTPAPAVTLSALLPNPSHMLSMEVAPTSAANIDWLTTALAGTSEAPVPASRLVEEAAEVPAGADGLLYLPFINGAAEHPSASGTFLGLSPMHRRGHLTRAVMEGVAQYHRVQLERVLACGADIAKRPWRLAGGGARSTVWAQIFADILGRPVERQTTSELGARGVASLIAPALGHDHVEWNTPEAHRTVVSPSADQAVYRSHGALFDDCVSSMTSVWDRIDQARSSG
jgi:L-xylulokinase